MSNADGSLSLNQTDLQRLLDFHATHFPKPYGGSLSAPTQDEESGEADDGLGYYPDGTKRTLTDEQIEMFRHSEIQRLLAQRKQQRAREEEQREIGHSAQHAQPSRRLHKRRFEDDVPQQQEQVDTLIYEDEPETKATGGGNNRKVFQWPKLGS